MVMRHVQMLQRRVKDRLDETDGEHVQTAILGAKHMERLIEYLKDNEEFGRRAAETVDCEQIPAKVIRVLQSDINSSNATVNVAPLPTVIANERELLIVFQNLISNAIKYRAERPLVIEIGVQRDGMNWLLWVRDNGIGIERKDFPKIFQIWTRLLQKPDVAGRGIGLANCKKAIERRGGRIWLESEPGAGTTFYFTLPAADEATAAD